MDVGLPWGPKARLVLYHLNAEAMRQKSRLIEVEATSHPLTFAGRPARLVMAVDITDRVRAEAERDRLLAERDQMLTRYGLILDRMRTVAGATGSGPSRRAPGRTTRARATTS